MYICEKCNRSWSQEDAQLNEYFCHRKCNGKLVLIKEQILPTKKLSKILPFPIAYPWYMSQETSLEPVKRVNNMIFTVYQVMRFTGLLLLSDYLESEGHCAKLGRPLAKMRMPHWAEWKTLTDTLAKYITGGYKDYAQPKNPAFGNLATGWIKLSKEWKKNPLSSNFQKMNEISPMLIFQTLRNDRAHRQGVMQAIGDEEKILEKHMPVLQVILDSLFMENYMRLLRLPIIDSVSKEEIETILEDELSSTLPVIDMTGAHLDFKFETTKVEHSDDIRSAFRKSSVAIIFKGRSLPLYPFFLTLDREEKKTFGIIEPYMANAFSNKKVEYLGVKDSYTLDSMGEKLGEALGKKGHEMGLSGQEANRWLMVEWARDHANQTLENHINKKYFPQCYIVRNIDRKLEQASYRSSKAIVATGGAGTGKSSLCCRFVEKLIQRSAEQEDTALRQNHFNKKVKNKDTRMASTADVFMSLRGSGDVVIFLSGRASIPMESSETAEHAFCRALLRVCGVKVGEFATPLEFMKRLDENVTAADNSGKKDENPNRKVWLVIDAVNETERFKDFANYLDCFIKDTTSFPWLKIIVSIRQGAYLSLLDRERKANGSGKLPFSDKACYEIFLNSYPTGDTEELFLNIPEFTDKESRNAYETRQKNMPESSTNNKYDQLPASLKELLKNPLYLHIFNETWKNETADTGTLTGENSLFEAYLNAICGDIPNMEETLKKIGTYLYENETSVWPEEQAWRLTQNWIKTNHFDSVQRFCTLTPVETLVSASLLMRPTEDEKGYQFSHQKICEQILKWELLFGWETIPKQKDSVIALFQQWLEKGEKFDWVANATASLFREWLHDEKGQHLIQIFQTKGKFNNALYTVFLSLFLEMVKMENLNVHALELIQKGFEKPVFYKPFIAALGEAYSIANTTGQTNSSFEIWKTVIPCQKLMVEQEPDRSDFQNDLAASFINAGNIYEAMGDGKKALEFYEKSMKIMENLVEQKPHRTDFQRALAIAFNNMGIIYEAISDDIKAIEFYKKSSNVREGLVEQEPDRSDFQSDLAASFNNIGNFYEGISDEENAQKFYEKSMKIMENLVEQKPDRTDFQRALAVTFNNIGIIYETMFSIKKTLRYYAKALEIRKGLVEKEPNRTDFQSDLAASFNNIGNFYEKMHDRKKTLEFYEKSLKVNRSLVEQEPARTDFRRNLSVSFNNVGNSYEAMGDGKKALEFYAKSLKVMRSLVEQEPDKTDFRRILRITFNNIGRTYEAMGDGKKAQMFYEKALKTERESDRSPHLKLQEELFRAADEMGKWPWL